MGYDCMTEYDSAADLYYQSLEEEMRAEQEQAIPVKPAPSLIDDDDIPF